MNRRFPQIMGMFAGVINFVITAAGHTSRGTEMLAWLSVFVWAAAAYVLDKERS